MKLIVGQRAPKIKGIDYTGKWHIVYFYPKDFTPGCITEACEFRDNFSALSKRVTIVGVSGDSESSHKKFIDHYHLPFALISDPDKKIREAFGAYSRMSFLIDPAGTIIKIYDHVDPKTHAVEILQSL